MKKNKTNYSLVGIISISVLIYILIVMALNITKQSIETYTLNLININTDIHADAFIIRDEKTIKAEKSGNIIFCTSNLGKVLKDDILYVNDSSGNFSSKYKDLLSNTHKEISTPLRNEIDSQINLIINNSDYNNLNKLNSLYQFIHDSYITDINIDDLNKLIEEYSKDSTDLTPYKSNDSGIFVNSVDGYEDININNVFDKINNFSKTKTNNVLSNTHVEKDEPIGKIVTSENWCVVFEISEKENNNLSETKYVNITFDSDNNTILGKLEIKKVNDKFYAIVSFDQGFIRYAHLRTALISINKTPFIGYSIPKKSVKEVDGKTGVFVSNSGIAEFVPVQIIGEEENMYLINLNENLKTYDNIVSNAENINNGDRIYK